MKKTSLLPWLAGILAVLALPAVGRAQADGLADYDRLLAKYATPRGVRYAEWKASAADVAALNGVVEAHARAGATPGGREAKLAFYINAYNANVLRGVLEKYPLKSVRDIAPLFGFFTQNRITVSGEKMSLNHLEKDVVRALSEPRTHFALNCASASCPPLRARAFTAAGLDGELNGVTDPFVTDNPRGVEARDGGKAAAVSKIFDWYAADFQPAGGALAFINKHRRPPLPGDAKLSFQDYDWSLNAAR